MPPSARSARRVIRTMQLLRFEPVAKVDHLSDLPGMLRPWR